MSLNIGRVIIDEEPETVSHAGDSLSVSGWFFGDTAGHANVIRQQFLGLEDNADEPDVPVTWSVDAAVDGYYTVESVNVTPVRVISPIHFGFQYSVSLSRVRGGFALPAVEVAATGALRVNAHSVISSGAAIFVGVPVVATFANARLQDGRSAPIVFSIVRNAVTGVVGLAATQVLNTSFMSVVFALQPADYYDAAAVIEQSVGGVWYPVVGDQIGNIQGNLLRIGNGLIRATFHTDGAITTEIFDGTVWESATAFSLRDNGTDLWSAAGGWRILRNDPAACTIRAAVAPINGVSEGQTITLHVERGRFNIELFVDNMFYDRVGTDHAPSLQLRANTVTATTSITGGIRQTSNGAEGHRWFILTPSAFTPDNTNGRVSIAAQSAPLIAQFALAWELNGSAAAGDNTVSTISGHYWAVTGTRQRVVSK